LESRIESETSWYNRFEIGPFASGQALTVANALRRALLAQQKGIFLTGVEIEGAIHEYSRLEGTKESILDILLNLRQVALIIKNEKEFDGISENLIGYFDIQGPSVVTAADFKFPKKVECINPKQHIATLTRNSSFQGRFVVSVNPSFHFKDAAIGDPLSFSRHVDNSETSFKVPSIQWLYVNPIPHPIHRVNYVVEQFGDPWEQKEAIVFEIWTNGTIHPKKALQTASFELAGLFSTISANNDFSAKSVSSIERFRTLKADQVQSQLKNETKNDYPGGDKHIDRSTALFDLDIANLNLSLTTFITLKRNNVNNIGQLLQFKKDEYRVMFNCTSDQLSEMEKALEALGLNFLS
jgi:DNA-directed RNA polymerase subunit alpha